MSKTPGELPSADELHGGDGSQGGIESQAVDGDSPGDEESSASVVVATLGRVLGPLVGLGVFFVLPETELAFADRGVAAVGAWMAVYWVTEALPLPVTALLPIVLFPFVEIRGGEAVTIREVAAPYAHEFIFLFLGGFLLALSVERWNLHRRFALLTLLLFGTRPSRIVAGFMVSTALISMWLSNTATVAMLYPIGLSVAGLLGDRDSIDERSSRPSRFAVCLLLAIAYSASIGGMGTLVGTPPNVFLAGFMKSEYGVELGFGRWMVFALPLVVVSLIVGWVLLTRWLFRSSDREIAGSRQFVRDELRELGPLDRGSWTVIGVFSLTAGLWVFREPLASWDALVEVLPFFARWSDAGIAVFGGILLFAIPVDARRGVFVLDWEATRRLPWGVLLLFGGGLSLAAAMARSEVPAWIGGHVPADWSAAASVCAIVVLIVFLTELTSNTATVAIFLPIVSVLARAAGETELSYCLPAALAASCAFMMPVATPPNAIVFGSGHVSIGAMVRAGFWFNLMSIVLIPAAVFALAARVFG